MNALKEKVLYLWENAEKFLVILFFATFTLNIRKVFLTPHSFLNGEFNEYLTISVGWADLLMFLVIIIYTIKYIIKQHFSRLSYYPIYSNKFYLLSIRKLYSNVSRETFVLLLFTLWIALSIFWSQNTVISIYRFSTILEIIGFFVVILQLLKNQKLLSLTIIALIFNGLVQSLIGISQFIHNKSIGLHFFGESVLATDIDGVAKFIINGEKHIRAYGTMPHPNILAGFLLIPLFLLINALIKTQKINVPRGTKYKASRYSFWSILPFFWGSEIHENKKGDTLPNSAKTGWFSAERDKFSYFVIIISFSIIGLGFLLTFSRSAFLGLVISAAICIAISFSKNALGKINFKTVFLVIIFLFLLLPILKNHTSLFSDKSMKERTFYQNVSRETISEHSLRGIGIGQFVPFEFSRYPSLQSWQYQPVHNIYFLILAELGLAGLVLFLLFIFLLLFSKEEKNERGEMLLTYYPYYFLIISLLVISIFDHYIWDIKLGIIIFAISIALFQREKNCIPDRSS